MGPIEFGPATDHLWATWERYPQKWFASRTPVIFREQDSDNGA